LKLWARELMAGQGMGVGEDSISTVPPIRAAPTTLRTGPRRTVGASPPPTRATDRGFVAPTVPTAPAVAAPTTQPTAPAVEAASPAPPGQPGVAPASSQVPATRLQPVPQPPPPTPAQTPTQGDGGGTLWVDEEDGLQKRRRKKKKKGAPLLLLLIGLLAGGAMAIVAVVGVLLVMRSTEPDEVVEVTPDTHEFGDLSMAPEPTPARPTPTRTRRPTTPRPVEAAAVIAADTPEQTPEATPEPTPELVVVDPVVVSPATVTPTPRPTARPTRAPEPTPQATPASAQSERDRLSEERRRALLGDRATPRPKEETYSGPPALAQPRVVRLDEDDEGVRVRFQVQIKGSCTDPSLTLKYNPPGASWLTAPMRVKDGGRAMVNLTFAPKNQGKVVYKIEGACAGGESLASGTVKHVVE
jgi:hypothetical protein